MAAMDSPVHYLTEAEALTHAPGPREAVDLADRALRAIAVGRVVLAHNVVRSRATTGLSAIIGVVNDGHADLAGQKWVSESRDGGIGAQIFLNDPATGLLHTILGARGLTALRTAAVSGACVRALAPEGPVALIGAGLQCRSHLHVLEALERLDVRVACRRRESAEELVAWARQHAPRVRLSLHTERREAVAEAGTVITMVARGSTDAHVEAAWLRADALLLPVDFAHCIDGSTACAAELVATDHPPTYEDMRTHGELPGYPATTVATGTALSWRPRGGRIVIQNLGNAAGDLLIADVVRRAALAAGAGRWLPR